MFMSYRSRLFCCLLAAACAGVASGFSRTATVVESGFSRTVTGVVSGFSRTLYAQAPPKQAVVETSLGTFIIDLTPEAAPNYTAFFIKTAESGAYNGTTFHRLVKYGMVQGGDPLSK